MIKKVTLITPNIPESEILTNIKIKDINDMKLASKKLLKMGAKNVLIKGGHLKTDEIVDIFLNKNSFKLFKNINFFSICSC